mmetsp:Transcript_89323/g.216696  ORF Transcript_89323/g.216696 Transcript_89323/m.216696 type:complete len:144 (-) Transcript_89323:375-806(-)
MPPCLCNSQLSGQGGWLGMKHRLDLWIWVRSERQKVLIKFELHRNMFKSFNILSNCCQCYFTVSAESIGSILQGHATLCNGNLNNSSVEAQLRGNIHQGHAILCESHSDDLMIVQELAWCMRQGQATLCHGGPYNLSALAQEG